MSMQKCNPIVFAPSRSKFQTDPLPVGSMRCPPRLMRTGPRRRATSGNPAPTTGIPFRSPRFCRAGRRESSTGGTASLPPGRVPGGYPEEPAAPTRCAGHQVVGVGRVYQDLLVVVAATPLPCPRPSFTGDDGGLLVSMPGPKTAVVG